MKVQWLFSIPEYPEISPSVAFIIQFCVLPLVSDRHFTTSVKINWTSNYLLSTLLDFWNRENNYFLNFELFSMKTVSLLLIVQ